MPLPLKRAPAVFYRTAAGREPVREWLKKLPAEERRIIGRDLQRVEYGWPIGMPLCRSLGQGLHEVRSDLPSGRTARTLFYVAGGELILLHAFMKKTQKTPAADFELALRNRRMHERGSR